MEELFDTNILESSIPEKYESKNTTNYSKTIDPLNDIINYHYILFLLINTRTSVDTIYDLAQTIQRIKNHLKYCNFPEAVCKIRKILSMTCTILIDLMVLKNENTHIQHLITSRRELINLTHVKTYSHSCKSEINEINRMIITLNAVLEQFKK